MDLEEERLSSDSVKNARQAAVVDNGESVVAVVVAGYGVDSSGSFVNERDPVDSRDLVDEGNRTGEQLGSLVVNSVSPSGSRELTPEKGYYGLKK